MNYWGCFANGLGDLFESYADYFALGMETLTSTADAYITSYFKDKAEARGAGNNGWGVGNGTPYFTEGKGGHGGHSGWGNAGMTAYLFWEWYRYTGDEDLLRNTVYPVIEGAAKMCSKMVVNIDGKYYYQYSTSPENGKQMDADGDGKQDEYYLDVTGYDQQAFEAVGTAVLEAANILGYTEEDHPILATLKEQVGNYNPVAVGWDGQVKEYYKENYYGEWGSDYTHRHISHLMGLFPYDVIDDDTEAWIDAAEVTLDKRGDANNFFTGWGTSHRMELRARAEDGDHLYTLYQHLLGEGTTYPNLWDAHSPFQIDGNFGSVAGLAEGFVQSDGDSIELLPALCSEWSTGSFSGLKARGNFTIAANWENSQATRFSVTSGNGGTCALEYYNLSDATLRDGSGNQVDFTVIDNDIISFETTKGETYTVTEIPAYTLTQDVKDVTLAVETDGIALTWADATESGMAGAVSYNVYCATESDANYILLGNTTAKTYKVETILDTAFRRYKVKGVAADGRESEGVWVALRPIEDTEITSYTFADGDVQLSIGEVADATSYTVYRKTNQGYVKLDTVTSQSILIKNGAGAEYGVQVHTGKVSSAIQPVILTGTVTDSNILQGKAVTTTAVDPFRLQPAAVSSAWYREADTSVPEYVNDGNAATVYEPYGAGASYTLTFDLAGEYTLSGLQVFGNTKNETATAEVYNAVTETCTVAAESVSLEGKVTFAAPVTGSQLRVTVYAFKNAYPHLSELQAFGQLVACPEKDADADVIDQTPVTVNGSVVTVTSITNEAGAKMTLRAIDATGTIVHLDEFVAAADGTYTYTFRLPDTTAAGTVQIQLAEQNYAPFVLTVQR